MSNHKMKWLSVGKPDPIQAFQAVCSCRWRSESSMNRQEIEDQIRDHHERIDKLRATLGGKPTLESQRDYFTAQADDEGNTESDRRLWRQLADELDHRLNDAATPNQGQSQLW